MLTNYDLLNEVAKKKIQTFISTGMSSMLDVKKAVNIFKKKRCPFILMHSVSQYPCPIEDLNLKMIQSLKKVFKCEVGYSGHESSVSPSVYAACLGSNYIERHITIDRAMWGTDQAASLGPDGMRLLRSSLDNFIVSKGNGIKKFLLDEKEKLKTMKYW
jgi:N-acetylneuraminate synthase